MSRWLVSVFFFSFCAASPSFAATDRALPAPPAIKDVGALLRSPSRSEGVLTTVIGEVGEVLGPNAFVLQSRRDRSRKILVVGPAKDFAATPETVIPGRTLTISGVVRGVDGEHIPRELKSAGPAVRARLRKEPVVFMADAILKR